MCIFMNNINLTYDSSCVKGFLKRRWETAIEQKNYRRPLNGSPDSSLDKLRKTGRLVGTI